MLMTSSAMVAAIAFFAALLSGQNSKAYSQPSGKVTMIGDSITVGAESYLTKEIPGVTTNAQAGRTWDQGLQVLKSMGTVGDTVVFALGTNSGVTPSQIRALKSAAQGKKIVLMTIYGTSTSNIASYMDSSNKAINASGLTIADWYTKAKSNQSWFRADTLGVHPDAAGSREFAKTIASAVSSAGSTTSGGGGIASASSCVITKVGNPKESTPPLPPECRSSSGGSGVDTNLGYAPPNYRSDESLPTMVSMRVDCPGSLTVKIDQNDNEAFWKFLFTHEMEHTVGNCRTREQAKRNEHINAHNSEGAVSYYGGHASTCTGSDIISADYADTIAYYSGPDASLSSVWDICWHDDPPDPYYSLQPPKSMHLDNGAKPVMAKQTWLSLTWKNTCCKT